MTQLEEIEKELKRVGFYVENDDDDQNPSLIVKRKPTSKKFLFEMVFTKKGKLIHMCAGPKETKVAWFNVTLYKK